MTFTCTPLHAAAEKEMEDWMRLRAMFRKADSIISLATARIERAERLRTGASPSVTGVTAAVLARSARDESLGRGDMAIIPAYRERLLDMLDEARERLNRALVDG
jgi:hypothetical protein